MPRVSQSILRGIRVFFGCLYLLSMLITIPISFRVGGLYCGLMFTVTLFYLYFVTATLTVLAKHSQNRMYIMCSTFVYYMQHLIISSLLYIFLSWFSDQGLNEKLQQISEQGWSQLEAPWSSLLYNYYKFAVKPWQFLLSNSTPFFTLSEGFFTILAIQAVGETHHWLKYQKNANIWVIASLLTSGGVITASLYYLYRIYVTPFWKLSIQAASLLGFTLSLICGVGVYGIVSHNGSVIESSLFFAYIVRCIYEISPKLATTATDELLDILKDTWQRHQGALPIADNILFYYHNVVLKNLSLIWDTIVTKTSTQTGSFHSSYRMVLPKFHNLWAVFNPIWAILTNFTVSVPHSINEILQLTLNMAFESVSPAVVINLCFRVLIFYSATRIIPALQKRSTVESDKTRVIMKVLYWYSPCILIAMYSHLILQYSGELKRDLCLWGCNERWFGPNRKEVVVDSWGFWNWCNIFWTIIIYGNELINGGEK